MGQPTSASIGDMKKQESKETETLHLGVYEVLCKKKDPLFKPGQFTFDREHALQLLSGWYTSCLLVWQVVVEIYNLRPTLLKALLALRVWDSIEEVLLLHFETKILRAIEIGFKESSVDIVEIVFWVTVRLLSVSVSSVVKRSCRHIQPQMQATVKHHYDDVLLRAKLNMDLPKLKDNITHDRVSSDLPWETMEAVMDLASRVVGLVGQFGLVLTIVRSSKIGLVFTLLCMARPILSTISVDNLWTRPRVVEATNKHFLRMSALSELANKKYRHELLSGGIVPYVLNEFKHARIALGDTSVASPDDQYDDQKGSYFVAALQEVAGEFPMIYYAFLVLFRPTKTSLSTIAALQQTTTFLRWQFYDIYYQLQTFRHRLSDLQQLFDIHNMEKTVKDGEMSYPTEKESKDGMAFELKNVSFSYPGVSQSKALDDVSFQIPAGQLVVVVGENGSGKSTFINLLTRMYDVSSGEVRVDGEDIRNLKLDEYRQATATLTQEHELFPLTIAENIGIGYPEECTNREAILDAAKKGGCEGVLGKMDMGLETILDPVVVQYSAMVDETKEDDELNKASQKFKKTHEVSGGERQRLVAARTFMRFRSGKIKFVAVDEPSSALDPQGELDLFNNLREARKGKTMLFVTHRFGPLTKHADQIICMKGGKVAEFGTHTELMKREGEYYKMYNIQAKAFESGIIEEVKPDSG